MPSESHQTSGFEAESTRFVQSHLGIGHTAPSLLTGLALFESWKPDRLLDVGCGSGDFLVSAMDAFGAREGTGVEPSVEAVSILRTRFADDPRLAFDVASVHALPYPADSFDMVICWSVLHWVGRNEYLQALGELIRVTRRYLVVMDFVAGQDHRTPYRHDDRYYTYKMDFTVPLLASGVLGQRADVRWWSPDGSDVRYVLAAADLSPFLGNPLNYRARRMCVFEKDYDILEDRRMGDFEPVTS